jgi:hypothetical protein
LVNTLLSIATSMWASNKQRKKIFKPNHGKS